MKDASPSEPQGPSAFQVQLKLTDIKLHSDDSIAEMAHTFCPPFVAVFLNRLRGYQVIGVPSKSDAEDNRIQTQGFRRFWRWHILGCVLLCIVLLVVVLPSLVVSAVKQRQSHRPSSVIDMNHVRTPLEGCMHWFPWHFGMEASPVPHEFLGQMYMHTVNSSFALPASAVALSLGSYGTSESIHGSLELLVDDTQRYPGSDDVHVEVTAFVDDPNLLQRTAAMCLVPGAVLNETRVGLITVDVLLHFNYLSGLTAHQSRLQNTLLTSPQASDRAAFLIRIYFPLSDGSPLHFNHFKALMPNFEYHANLGDRVSFQDVSLESPDSPINASITGHNIRVKTSNAPIYGSYNTTHTLDLMTQNAPIEVSARAIAADDDSAAANIRLTFSTSNAKVRVAMIEAPIDGIVQAILHTMNAPARLYLPETFAGWFSLSSTHWHAPQVHFDADAQTPRLEREVETFPKTSESEVSGRVEWASQTGRPTGMLRHHVNVVTSNSDVDLFL
ncbi:uncharacterized protein FIBRA_02905 [Fibroporia radiculosa]|uniref:Uncharacterized protein n=1 Tax=Fibroporia radiculosa TaxID=599839 RepID=J4H240_9APHY|nr:uncharacterized protein FIBRA_02905 [Fibroporia radiculosa]CCM00859.1 predicted protein [Fibroporia radiculosa]